MKDRAPNKTAAEQLELIMACRSSGLTDIEWCRQNGILPGTFYNWVKRLRKRGCTQIPDRITRSTELIPTFHQDVVKVEILPEPEPESVYSPVPVIDKPNLGNCIVAEIKIGKASLKVMDGMSPALLKVMLRELKGGKNAR